MIPLEGSTAKNLGLIQPKIGCFSCSLVSSRGLYLLTCVLYKSHYSYGSTSMNV